MIHDQLKTSIQLARCLGTSQEWIEDRMRTGHLPFVDICGEPMMFLKTTIQAIETLGYHNMTELREKLNAVEADRVQQPVSGAGPI